MENGLENIKTRHRKTSQILLHKLTKSELRAGTKASGAAEQMTVGSSGGRLGDSLDQALLAEGGHLEAWFEQ